ncbi:MAG: hypothetical protein HF981_13870 [Desulfobacteraceae bacterium]|nr:hypothetical protein [Desulfobacteraceae bacterium]MBC2751470.1 endonuclease/exonuclease/phosphatase family protein [Desulfobacteraceae bacterium]
MMKSSTVHPKKGIVHFAVVLTLALIIQLPALAGAEELRVMTRNLYLGAEIQSLAAAGSYEEFLDGVEDALMQIAANNFSERAEALAAEIVEKKPHLVGLQEVYDFKLNGGNYPCPPFCDYLGELLLQIEAQGASYRPVATVKNFDITIPFFDGMIVSVLDRDVILVRDDVETADVDVSGFCPDRVSDDKNGCNYQLVASAEIPPPDESSDPLTIDFTRSFVAIDAWIDDYPVRVVNTHLEVRYPDPDNPFSPFIQAAQAQELTIFLQLFPNEEGGPTLLLGDINSSPADEPIRTQLPFGTIVPPYMQLVNAGYFDAWPLRPGKPKGFTCCFGEDLSEKADLYERIDIIFSSEKPNRVRANVVGNSPSDRTDSGLWPSDHAGLAGRLRFP